MFEETPIKDLLIYKPRIFEDHRGLFFESFNATHFADRKINSHFVQDNRSVSTYGTLRGLHMQTGGSAQAKLVGVLSGQVYDVAVDVRPGSVTFGQWFGIELNDKEVKFLYIPRGFAHGFVVLSEKAEFFYKVDNYYDKSRETGIIFNDADLNIEWPLSVNKLVISDKDQKLPNFKQLSEILHQPEVKL